MHPNDPKLVHLVRKYWLRGENDDEKVLESLLVNHREYQRKNLDRLHATVVLVLERLNNEGEEDSEYERQAAAQDSATNSSRSGLNASLCNSYRKRSDETDVLETPTGGKDAENTTEPATPQTTTNSTLRKKKRRKVKRATEATANEDSLPSSLSTSAAPRSFLVPERPTARYSDLGGIHDTITTIRQRIGYPLQHTHVYTHLGIAPPRGILLKGPPGTGKSHLANAVAGELGGTVSYYKVSAPEVVSGVSGESEQTIRSLFQAAIETAPSLIFFDELDVICPKRNDQSRGMEQRIVAQLLTCLDSLWPTPNQQCVMVLAATNRPDALDPAIRRRFATELELGVPDQEARARMIQTMTQNMRTQLSAAQIQTLAQSTPGYVGADVQSLLQQAAEIAIHRIVSTSSSAMNSPAIEEEKREPVEEAMEDVEATSSVSATAPAAGNDTTAPSITITPADLQDAAVTMQDFLDALPLVQPSAQREGFATVPDVSFDAIGALADIRAELTLSVLEPIRAPERFAQLGLTIPAGVLLYGPPGCGKTLLAKAIAHAAAANFISVKGPALLDKYVGESERAVRVVFERARSSSPCIVFFDELDALVPKRSSGGDGGGRVTERVVNQLLTELDGLDARKSVFIVAATNRPELIDPAMLRPGRLDKLLYVPLPTPSERVLILQTLAKNVAVDPSVDLAILAKHPSANGYSGADCAALLREAGLAVLKEQTAATELPTSAPPPPPLTIQTHHFERAFAAVRPSVSKQDQKRYERIRDRMASARSRAPEEDTQQTGRKE